MVLLSVFQTKLRRISVFITFTIIIIMCTVTREDCHGNHERLYKISFGLIVMKLHMNVFAMCSCACMLKYFKMATVAMITMKVKTNFVFI